MQMLEAFRALNALNEDIFSLDAEGVSKLSDFTQNDDLEDDVQIIDPEAETEDDLQDNYIGKVILDCCVCHSKLYKDKSEVNVDEAGELANVGEECPYCFTPDGFKVIGEVVAFGEESKEDEDSSEHSNEESDEDAAQESADDEDENVISESLNESNIPAAFGGTIRGCGGSTNRNTHNMLNGKQTKKVLAKDLKPGMVTNTGKINIVRDCGNSMEIRYLGGDSDNVRHDMEYEVLDESFNAQLNEGNTVDIASFLNAHMDKIIPILKKIWPKNLTASQQQEIKNNLRLIQGSTEGNKLNKLHTEVNRKDPEQTNDDEIKNTSMAREESDESISEGIFGFKSRKEKEAERQARIAKNNADFEAQMKAEEERERAKGARIAQEWKDIEARKRQTVQAEERAYYNKLKGSNPSNTGHTGVNYSGGDYYSESINESIDDLSMTANGTHLDISEEDSGKVTVTMEPATNDNGGEMIAPVSPESEAEIMADEVTDPTMDISDEELGFEDPVPEENSEVDADFDEFDEESMDGLGESYFKRVYENVNSFKTTAVKTSGNSMIIEGLLEFNSGNKKNTSFVFEALDATKTGKFRFVGDNKELTEGKKAFMLTGTINNNKLMVESMNYNYKHTDAEGKTSRVYGTERFNKGE